MDAFDNLRSAVVKQAAEDYAAAFMGERVDRKEPEEMLSECEKFFRSGWYSTLTSNAIDGEWLMREIKVRELEKTIALYELLTNPDNHACFKVNVTFPKVKDEPKRKPVNYTFPPKLASGLLDMARIQLEDLKGALKGLKPDSGEESK